VLSIILSDNGSQYFTFCVKVQDFSLMHDGYVFVYLFSRMADIPPPSSPQWKRPNEVMKLHLAKKKRKALQDRINSSKPLAASRQTPFSISHKAEQDLSVPRNCFRVGGGVKRSSDGNPVESCSDNSLFNLLDEENTLLQQTLDTPVSFSNLFKNKSEIVVSSLILPYIISLLLFLNQRKFCRWTLCGRKEKTIYQLTGPWALKCALYLQNLLVLVLH